METLITTRPPRTIREVYDALPEGTLAQLIENQLVMSPAPTYGHQKLLIKLCYLIYNFLDQNEIGKVIVAPFDVHLDDENVYQPDILCFRNDKLSNIREDGFYGAPDLIIELLSSSTSKYDLGPKKAGYERQGVQEYWIVDPDTKDVEGYFLKEGRYGDPINYVGLISSKLLGEEFAFS